MLWDQIISLTKTQCFAQKRIIKNNSLIRQQACWKNEKLTPTYREALITREKSFPTGLDMEFLGKDLPNVAIPHTDIVHNLAEKVVVVRLEKPVTFHNMIAPDKEVEVSLLFFIINNSSSSQTNILAQLMDFFTGNGHLEDLSKISEPEKLYAYIAEATA